MNNAAVDKIMKQISKSIFAFAIIYILLLVWGITLLISIEKLEKINEFMYTWGFPIVVCVLLLLMGVVHYFNKRNFEQFHLGIYIRFVETLLGLMAGIYLKEIEQPLWLFSVSLFFVSLLKGLSWAFHFNAYIGKSKEQIKNENYVEK
ncbi:hypothetical protein ACWNS2_10155 [Planococcus plakortidis]